MSDLYLGLIALAVLVMATIQVGAIIAAARAVRRLSALADRVEREVSPIVESVRAMAADAAKTASSAAVQVNRVDALTQQLVQRVDRTASVLETSILRPVREGYAVISAVRTVVSSLRDIQAGRAARPTASTPVEDDDALFIG